MQRLPKIKALALLLILCTGLMSYAQPAFVLSSSLCAGTSVTLTATTGTFAANAYSWQAIPAGPVFSAQSASLSQVTFPQPGTYSLVVEVSDGTSVLQTQHTVTVHPVPLVNIAPSATAVCSGKDATLIASGASTYTWPPLIGLYYFAHNTAYVMPGATTTYSVIGSNSFGCTDTASYEIVVNIPVNLNLFPSSSSVCANSHVTLTAAGALSYTWSGNVPPASAHQPTLLAGPGSYSVLGADGACIDSAYITIGLAPGLNISTSLSRNTVCINDGDSSVAVNLSASGAQYYTWAPFDPVRMTYSLGATTMVSPTMSTCYTVTASTDVCSATAMLCVDVLTCTAITELAYNRMPKIYPNPVRDKLYIEWEEMGPFTLRVTDLSGVTQISEKREGQEGVIQELPVEGLPPGIYFMYLSSGNKGTSVIRIIRH